MGFPAQTSHPFRRKPAGCSGPNLPLRADWNWGSAAVVTDMLHDYYCGRSTATSILTDMPIPSSFSICRSSPAIRKSRCTWTINRAIGCLLTTPERLRISPIHRRESERRSRCSLQSISPVVSSMSKHGSQGVYDTIEATRHTLEYAGVSPQIIAPVCVYEPRSHAGILRHIGR